LFFSTLSATRQAPEQTATQTGIAHAITYCALLQTDITARPQHEKKHPRECRPHNLRYDLKHKADRNHNDAASCSGSGADDAGAAKSQRTAKQDAGRVVSGTQTPHARSDRALTRSKRLDMMHRYLRGSCSCSHKAEARCCTQQHKAMIGTVQQQRSHYSITHHPTQPPAPNRMLVAPRQRQCTCTDWLP
jgi:hypothetical protein